MTVWHLAFKNFNAHCQKKLSHNCIGSISRVSRFSGELVTECWVLLQQQTLLQEPFQARPSLTFPLLASPCGRSDEEISDQEIDPTNCYWVIFQPGVSKSSLQCGHSDACDSVTERVTKGRDEVVTLLAEELPAGSRSRLKQKHTPGLGLALSAA